MQLPFFFEENIPESANFILSEDSSKHIVQVLRMKEPENLNITNGKGDIVTVSLKSAKKKSAEVQIISRSHFSRPSRKIIIGIALIKNKNRFEWFLEKVTEIGVTEIIPIISEHTEKQHYRNDRMRSILINAMLQSQQTWLPDLHQPIHFSDVIKDCYSQNKYIAHCIEDNKKNLASESEIPGDQLMLIGPEGDFTKEEVEAAIKNNFVPVSLGQTRLRTETAGLVAAVLLSNKLNRF